MPKFYVVLIVVGLVIVAGAIGLFVGGPGHHLVALGGAAAGALISLVGVVQTVGWTLGDQQDADGRSKGELEFLIQSMLFVASSDKTMHGLEVEHICKVLQNQYAVNVTLPFIKTISKRFTDQQLAAFPALVEQRRGKISPSMRDEIIAIAIGVANADRKMRAVERDAIYALSEKLQPPTMDRTKIDEALTRYVIVDDRGGAAT